MKWYLVVSFSLLVVALMCTVLLFIYTSGILSGKSSESATPQATSSVTKDEPQVTGDEEEVQSTSTAAVSEAQTQRLEEVGFEGELTEERIQCAISVLGESRATEIAAGDQPTFIEIGRLMSCL